MLNWWTDIIALAENASYSQFAEAQLNRSVDERLTGTASRALQTPRNFLN